MALKVPLIDRLLGRNTPVGKLEREDLPVQVRVQIVHILNDAEVLAANIQRPWRDFLKAHGIPLSIDNPDFENTIATSPTLVVLHALELLLSYMEDVYRIPERPVEVSEPSARPESNRWKLTAVQRPESSYAPGDPEISVVEDARKARKIGKAIEEVNEALQRSGVKYRYLGHQFVRVDSEYTFQHLIDPAIRLLSNESYPEAEQEFMVALKHFKETRYEDAAFHAGKAYEAFLKELAKREDWNVEAKNLPTAKDYVHKCMSELELPPWSEQQLLTSSIIRNKMAHPKDKDTSPPGYMIRPLAEFAIHSLAAATLFITETIEAKKRRR